MGIHLTAKDIRSFLIKMADDAEVATPQSPPTDTKELTPPEQPDLEGPQPPGMPGSESAEQPQSPDDKMATLESTLIELIGNA